MLLLFLLVLNQFLYIQFLIIFEYILASCSVCIKMIPYVVQQPLDFTSIAIPDHQIGITIILRFIIIIIIIMHLYSASIQLPALWRLYE